MKNGKTKTRVLAGLLSALMLISVLPMTAFAAETANFPKSQLSLVSDKKSTLATGVTQDIYTVYDKNGAQVKMFAALLICLSKQ